jgi:type I restriction enzyme, R subunit
MTNTELLGTMKGFFSNENELQKLWSFPMILKSLHDKQATIGFWNGKLIAHQNIISAEKSDLYDFMDHIAFAANPITREERVASAQDNIFVLLDHNQKEFVEFVLVKYIESGVEELDQEKLPALLELKYQAVSDATDKLGGVGKVKGLFVEFQKYLYEERVA